MGVNLRDLSTRRLHDAWAANCEATGLRPQMLAHMMSISTDTMYKQLEWDEARGRPHIYPYPDRVKRLIDLSGDDGFLRTLADDCGFTLVSKPDVGNPVLGELADMIGANAQAVQRIAEIYRDGAVDEREAKIDIPDAIRLCEQLVHEVLDLRAKLKADARAALAGPQTLAAAEAKGTYK